MKHIRELFRPRKRIESTFSVFDLNSERNPKQCGSGEIQSGESTKTMQSNSTHVRNESDHGKQTTKPIPKSKHTCTHAQLPSTQTMQSQPKSRSSSMKMSKKEFYAFMTRLNFYNLKYMNHEMVVGIDEQCITEDTKCVLADIKRAIRYTLFQQHECLTPDAIVFASKYAADQIAIVKLHILLSPIHESQPLHLSMRS
eukprot:CAMPEP_0202700940 /NCGR_PEP_ID=MMETSP1385-20130828/14059_1 /ASSEMBLY_ACC=CAM_ASM_000861 /TAXON_ID=933848 /ORGANISM="Elphidium margaritaceum" /LENGTH=197 /DNA_ID=CAMNT_0049358233 /DNA_START=28 /DNA_END=621 /DNA_ORIENTATION=-